jgi:hypothetical protein
MGRLSQFIARGVHPVDNDRNCKDLDCATKEHSRNGNAFSIAHDLTYRDEIDPEAGVSIDDLAIHHHRDRIADSGVASLGWASWLDAGTADAALRRFNTYPEASHVVIGAWNHGGLMQASPYRSPKAPVSPDFPVQWALIRRFFDAHLRDQQESAQDEPGMYYYTLGRDTWQKSDCWPPRGTRVETYYLSEGGQLTTIPGSSPDGADEYQVSTHASSGELSRWWELSVNINKTVVYSNRRQQASELLVYMTEPLSEDYEISGYPLITVYMRSSEPDGAIIAYLEDVAPDGSVFYLTEGELRAIHHPICNQPPPYQIQVPYHSYRQSDSRPLERGQVIEIKFGMQPVSAFVLRGHRLRLGLAGYDEENFAPIGGQSVPVWQVQRSAQYPSRIEIPVLHR